MIKSIRLQNFFGFQDCTINFEKGENVLVGINGSGKSNFFKAMKLFQALRFREKIHDLIINKWRGKNYVKFQNALPDEKILLTFYIDESSFLVANKLNSEDGMIRVQVEIALVNFSDYTITQIAVHSGKEIYRREIFSDRTESGSYLNPNIQNFLLAFPDSIEVFDIFETIEDSKIRKALTYSSDIRLLADGSNLPHLLNSINSLSASAFNKLEETLQKINTHYLRLKLIPILDSLTFGIQESNFEKATTAYALSDGTLRFLCLMAILYNPNRGKIICIDEPELGLHPDMINTLYRAIEHAAKTSQIIISTHSAHLLDYFHLQNIRVFEKDEKNATIVEQFNEDDFKGWYETFRPGHMWRAGDIGGNR